MIFHLLRDKLKDALEGEALEGARLDLLPHVIIRDVILREEGAVLDIREPLRSDAGGAVLDEPLHHAHAINIRVILVHEVDVVLSTLGQVFLRHNADGVSVIDYVVLAEVVITAEDGEVGPHDHAAHQPLLLVLHTVELHGTLLGQLDEIAVHGRVIHKGHAHYTRLFFSNKSLIYGKLVNCLDCHFLILT